MIKPTIHLNGTSRERLAEGYADAASKLREAISALAAAGPNRRDYYPQGLDIYTVAAADHEDRIARAEVYELAEHVADAP
jgi:hypothetical protein